MQRVKHQTYGKGTVISTSNDTVTVKFDSGKKGDFLKDFLIFLKEDSAGATGAKTYPEIVYANTNADFLNKRFGTNFKGWMKCGWDYDHDTIVWMVPFDNKVQNGWINTIVDSNTVREDYVGLEAFKLVGHQKIDKFHRIVVKKELDHSRYIILGLYRYDFENSKEPNLRVWKKVSDFI